MKGKMTINISDEIDKIEYWFGKTASDYYEDFDYLIDIDIPEHLSTDVNVYELKKDFNDNFIKNIANEHYIKDYPEEVKLIKEAFDNNIDLFDSCQTVVICTMHEDLMQMFKQQKDYTTKRFIIQNKEFKVTREDLENAKLLCNNHKNVYFKIDGNKENISLEDYIKTVEIIADIYEHIATYNMSPLEQVMYAFDYVRKRVYTEENKGEKYNESRDLTSVLLGDKIVCEGYANILDKILKGLGINSNVYYLKTDEKRRHALTIAYIKDDKYNIEGIYYFDATANRKINEQDTEYLDNYSYFARTKDGLRNLYPFSDETFGDYYIEEYQEFINNYKNLSFRNHKNILLSLKNINSFLERKKIERVYAPSSFVMVDEQQLIKNINEYQELYYRPIETEKLFNVLLNVRKIEYYENPELYELSVGKMLEILSNSKWYFDGYITQKFDYEDLIEEISTKYDDYDKEIQQVKLTKVLSNIKK